jgi:hypothetical protein
MARQETNAQIEVVLIKKPKTKKYPTNILYKYALLMASKSELLNIVGKYIFERRVKKLYKYG